MLKVIRRNLCQRAFKYGNFTPREYHIGQFRHGYEFLITRRGLDALAAVMRFNTRERVVKAYADAWDVAPKSLPAPEPAKAQDAVIVRPPQESVTDMSKVIQTLEGRIIGLSEELGKSRRTLRMYADMYENEKNRRRRNGDMSGYWHDLYSDLIWRVTNDGDNLSEQLEAHRSFRNRLNNHKKQCY